MRHCHFKNFMANLFDKTEYCVSRLWYPQFLKGKEYGYPASFLCCQVFAYRELCQWLAHWTIYVFRQELLDLVSLRIVANLWCVEVSFDGCVAWVDLPWLCAVGRVDPEKPRVSGETFKIEDWNGMVTLACLHVRTLMAS